MIIPKLAAPVVSCQDRTPSTVTFVWSEVEDAAGYQVNVNDAGWVDHSSGDTGTTHLIEHADPAMEYTIRVRALSAVPADFPCGEGASEAPTCSLQSFPEPSLHNPKRVVL